MDKLFEEDVRTIGIQSSKGNQLKWEQNGVWYKADYVGYEGLAEYMVSSLLKYSTLSEGEYIQYETTVIEYSNSKYVGCKSKNFLRGGWQLITLERLFQNFYGESLYKSIFQIQGIKERAVFLEEQVERMTGLRCFGKYLCKILTLDALFLNEDRHTHNIAVLLNEKGEYHLCPIFDNGSALLSDTMMDYPLEKDIIDLIPQVQAKTLSFDFYEQLDAVEELYGQSVKFTFNEKIVSDLLEKEKYYPKEIKHRVKEIILQQKRTYQYLFRA